MKETRLLSPGIALKNSPQADDPNFRRTMCCEGVVPSKREIRGVRAMIPARERRETDETAESLEVFARDLLVLSKTSSVYPEGHPAPRRVAERLAARAPSRDAGTTVIGITPSKLLLGDCFFGAKGSRTELVASYLHERKIMRLVWTPAVRPRDVLTFTALLATTRLAGAELRSEIKARNVFSIDVEPVDVSKIHGAISTGAATDASEAQSDERGCQTWLWLQNDAIEPSGIASVLGSAELWEAAERDASSVAALLFRHGARLDQALEQLPEAGRLEMRGRLEALGKALPAAEIGAILDRAFREAGLDRESVAGLLGKLDNQDIIDVLAALVALNGGRTGRLAGVFPHLVPQGATEEMLALVEARLSPEGGRGYAREVWNAVETFLLDLDEERFFGDDYLQTLDAISQGPPEADAPDALAHFRADSEGHVDWIYLSLARDEGGVQVERLRERLEARVSSLPVSQLLTLTIAIHRKVPPVFRHRDLLVQEVFSKIALNSRHLSKAEQADAIEFAKAHEATIIDLATSALVNERRIAGRKFLVELLSALSAETTLPMVSKACHAPWYYVRNVATVLGRRRERASAPVLEALLDHPDERVRKEALKSLATMGAPARKILGAFAEDVFRGRSDREFAKGMLERMGAR